jgi:hypothetical protein
MTDKVFVVNLKKLEEKEIELATLYEIPLTELKELSDFVLTPQQAVENLNNPDMADFNPEEYYCVYRKIELKEVTVAELNKVVEAIKHNSSFDGDIINLGNLLELKPVYSQLDKDTKVLEGIDVYRYADRELMEDEDYDFDSDYITTVYISPIWKTTAEL